MEPYCENCPHAQSEHVANEENCLKCSCKQFVGLLLKEVNITKSTATINDVKQRILDRIMEAPNFTKDWAEAYATLVQAECQEKMTEFGIGHCPDCDEEFPEDVG